MLGHGVSVAAEDEVQRIHKRAIEVEQDSAVVRGHLLGRFEREAGWVETERCLKLLGVALVGNLAAGFGLGLAARSGGEGALVAIGRKVAARGEGVSAFYTSNVEF